MTEAISRVALLEAALVLFAAVLPLFAAPYWIHVGALAWYYALLAASWALLAGYAGQFSFAQCAFAALGGYASALGVMKLGLSPATSILFAVFLAACAGALMGWLVLRLSGPYLALFTLAISEIFRLILIAEEPLTRGSLGLPVASSAPSMETAACSFIRSSTLPSSRGRAEPPRKLVCWFGIDGSKHCAGDIDEAARDLPHGLEP